MNIFIHIPKTGGTLLGMIFDHGSGRRLMYDYTDDYSQPLEPNERIRAHAPFIEDWFWGIHGHFYYRKYASVFPAAKFMTCVRHPIERMASQYRHELYDAINSDATSWKANALRKGISFPDWVRMDISVGRALATHLEGLEVENYEFIFVQEMLPDLLEAFSKRFNFHRRDPYAYSKLPIINAAVQRGFSSLKKETRYRELSAITDAEKKAAYLLIPEDVDIYQRAVKVAEGYLKAE